jgi:hypothetical protein
MVAVAFDERGIDPQVERDIAEVVRVGPAGRPLVLDVEPDPVGDLGGVRMRRVVRGPDGVEVRALDEPEIFLDERRRDRPAVERVGKQTPKSLAARPLIVNRLPWTSTSRKPTGDPTASPFNETSRV